MSWGALGAFWGVLGRIFGRHETVPRCANREVRWFQIGRASAASEASGALRRFCGPPPFQTAYAKASSIHMFPNASDTHPKTLRSIPNGHFLNALPVPCSPQVYENMCFSFGKYRFFAPMGLPRWTPNMERSWGVFGGVLGTSWGLVGAS